MEQLLLFQNQLLLYHLPQVLGPRLVRDLVGQAQRLEIIAVQLGQGSEARRGLLTGEADVLQSGEDAPVHEVGQERRVGRRHDGGVGLHVVDIHLALLMWWRMVNISHYWPVFVQIPLTFGEICKNWSHY